MFVLFIGAQIYSIALSFIVDEKGLGTAAQSGNAMAFFASEDSCWVWYSEDYPARREGSHYL